MLERKTENKKISEVKIYPVPFVRGAIKENISIKTKTINELSKEQIINQACKFHSEGNFSEAIKYYQNFIDRGFNDHIVFSNYGVILKSLNKFKEAEILQRKAIELKPDFVDAYCNLANVLQNLGRIKEAEILQRKAIEIKPNFTEAHNNLSTILKEQGKYKEAYDACLKATELNPNYDLAHNNLGIILKSLGQLNEAEKSINNAIKINPHFLEAHLALGNVLKDLGQSQRAFDSYITALKINQNSIETYSYISDFIRTRNPEELDQLKLKYIIDILLNKDEIDHSNLFEAFNSLYNLGSLNRLEKSDLNSLKFYINDDLLSKALKKIIFKDQSWEKLLTKIRQLFCERIAKNNKLKNKKMDNFIIGLAEQSFLNEYVYFTNKEEIKYIEIIINRCNSEGINNQDLSILACYYPLYKLREKIVSINSFKSTSQNLNNLFKLQFLEPLEEIKLSKRIRKIGLIENKISQKVKAQYENNPYPRWKDCNPFRKLKFSANEIINNEIKPNRLSNNIDINNLEVLIAGCGTGKQIIYAQRYKNAKITAIDLSSSSLSYSQRKINELNIKNTELIQMDILEVSLLKKKFDIIECCGVLHHMSDPNLGLKSLLSILSNNGFIKLSLYNKIARKNIIEARKIINELNLVPSIDNIRRFRSDVFSGMFPQLKSLCNSNSDFYTISECRDLCFHAQEYQFSINDIEQIIKSNRLRFHGFSFDLAFKSLYSYKYKDDKTHTNFKYLKEFEINYPQAFSDTPPFWISRID